MLSLKTALHFWGFIFLFCMLGIIFYLSISLAGHQESFSLVQKLQILMARSQQRGLCLSETFRALSLLTIFHFLAKQAGTMLFLIQKLFIAEPMFLPYAIPGLWRRLDDLYAVIFSFTASSTIVQKSVKSNLCISRPAFFTI